MCPMSPHHSLVLPETGSIATAAQLEAVKTTAHKRVCILSTTAEQAQYAAARIPFSSIVQHCAMLW